MKWPAREEFKTRSESAFQNMSSEVAMMDEFVPSRHPNDVRSCLAELAHYSRPPLPLHHEFGGFPDVARRRIVVSTGIQNLIRPTDCAIG
jgi:hypothetical protein